MSIIQTELYDALMAVKVPEDKARAAAEVAATVTTNYLKPGELVTKTDLKAELGLLKWMLGFNLLITATILLSGLS